MGQLSPRQVEAQRIIAAGYTPKICPTCSHSCLWPKKRQVMNSLSRKDSNTYICNPCGREEALADRGVE